MEARVKLGARYWEISNQPRHEESGLKSVSGDSMSSSAVGGIQETSLRMSSFPYRDSLTGEHDNHVSAMEYSWVPQKNLMSYSKCITHSSPTPVSPEMIDIQSTPMIQEDAIQNGQKEADLSNVKRRTSVPRKKSSRITTKVLRTKEPKKQTSVPRKKKGSSVSTGIHEKKNQDNIVVGVMPDFSSVPAPVCTCTGVPHQCYRWGAGGWQSSCCTTSISKYPLPMSTTRPGGRMAGRKMSIGAYGKLLLRLAAEGHDLSNAVDLKDHWARHGTNKFVTIR